MTAEGGPLLLYDFEVGSQPNEVTVLLFAADVSLPGGPAVPYESLSSRLSADQRLFRWACNPTEAVWTLPSSSRDSAAPQGEFQHMLEWLVASMLLREPAALGESITCGR